MKQTHVISEQTVIEKEGYRMTGTLFGIGVGPGDPELMTVKAVRQIQKCDIIAVPVSNREYSLKLGEELSEEVQRKYLKECVAYQIAQGGAPEVEAKRKIYLPMPMMKEKAVLKECHEYAADLVEAELKNGKDVAFLTLGDPTVYSTYLYVHRRMQKRGQKTTIIPGITSFCAAAARMNMGLVENKEELHIIPASYEIEAGLKLPGTKVLMKAGRQMEYVKEVVKEQQLEIAMVENCGMTEEKIYYAVESVPDQASYYSLMIIKGETK